MTAEIAILNKTAVALAADSAVTISAGTDQQKIYDTADKLFELTSNDAIAIMINSDMNFMEAPLPVLIKKYRQAAPRFEKVADAAVHFLRHLDEFGRKSPLRIADESVVVAVVPVLTVLNDRAREAWQAKVFDEDRNIRPEIAEQNDVPATIMRIAEETLNAQLDGFDRIIARLPAAQFVGGEQPSFDEHHRQVVRELVEEHLPTANPDQKDRAVGIAFQSLLKISLGGRGTGLVFAGFGSEELFPTLVSYEVYGMICGKLKYRETNNVDIDRNGDKARVLPFAQKEMVERFLYGLDQDIQTQITDFCKISVPSISEAILASLDMSDDDRAALAADAEKSELAFFEGLTENSFNEIRQQSRSEIEDMVEFMPKPEMARMAEALVNLTSIKRRVSRGFETVGGAIDVAIISQAEGFVWVKRKHYFPSELNTRYFDRMRHANAGEREPNHA